MLSCGGFMETHDNFAYLLPFIFFVFGCTFVFLGRFGAAAARYWGIGFISAALGFSIPIVLSEAPAALRAILAEACFLTAFFSYGHAVYRRFDLPALVLPRALFALAAMAVLSYVILVEGDLRAELIVSDLAGTTLLAVPVWSARKALRRPIDKLLGFMSAMVVLDGGSRVIGTLVLTTSGTYASLDSFLTSDYAFFTQVSASVIGFLLALTVLGTVMFDIVGQHRHAAEHDPLTNLLNRRGFERMIPDFGGDSFPAGAVLVCDIDHFKLVNDRFGHAAGDTVIVGLASSLRDGLPGDALTARFGGEEFVAFLPGVTLAEAGVLANAVRLAFEARDWQDGGISQQVTASFGVSSTARGDHSAHDAIGRADACLYAAKSGGRNQVVTEGQQGSQPAGVPQLRIISVA